MKIREIIDSISDLFYPRLCICCGKALNQSEKFVCTSCIATIPRTNFHLGLRNLAEESFAGKAYAQHVYSWFLSSHKSKFEQLIYDIKYRGNYKLAKELGATFAMELKNDGVVLNYDYIIPVPLHPKRKKQRGYNQSKYIADGVSEVFGGIVEENILLRELHTESQTRKTRFDRWENMKTAFRVCKREKEDFEKSILVIDDVTTTGATIAACIIALREAGYKNISVLTLAYRENR